MSRPLIIVPAIDLRGGFAVRLERGDPGRETRYDADPAGRAVAFAQAGAVMLHVVDLDGALGTGENIAALRAICRAVDVPVQTGGGIRSAPDVEARLALGVASVVIGTLLVEDPPAAQALAERYGERIVAGIDARGLRVATRGWQHEGGVDRDALVTSVTQWGVGRIIYTEIARDGTGSGYDLAALAQVARLTPLPITASGGAKTLDDLRAVRDRTPKNVDAAIVGRALYEGTIDLATAIAELAG